MVDAPVMAKVAMTATPTTAASANTIAIIYDCLLRCSMTHHTARYSATGIATTTMVAVTSASSNSSAFIMGPLSPPWRWWRLLPRM